MICYRPWLLLGLATVLTGGLQAAGEASIAASATAGSDYVRPTDAKGTPQPETYVFSEGKYFEGATVDRGLAKTTFADVTKILAGNLAKQNYFPATDVKSAQLLIMVHWGTTTIYDDPQKDFNQQMLTDATASYNSAIASSGTTDPTALNMALGAREDAQASQRDAINRNAVLLGYARSLEKERRELIPTNSEILLSNELNEERYFVILFAYDNQARLKERKSRVLWITRLSVRSPGNNFLEALPALAKAGSDVFGRQVDGLVRIKAPLRPGKVTLGETQFLGAVDSKAPPPESEKK
jgi:hypothetical protein